MTDHVYEYVGTFLPTSEGIKEELPHGDLLFSMCVRKTKVAGQQKVFSCGRQQEELEILLLRKGQARIQVGNSVWDVNSGEYVFIRPHEVWAIYSVGCDAMELCSILVHYNFVSSFLDDAIQQKYIFPLFSGSTGIFITRKDESAMKNMPLLLDIVSAYEKKGFGYEMLIKSRLLEILYHLSTYEEGAVTERCEHDRYKQERTQKLLQYLHENYSERITLAQMAQQVNISVGHLCRFFKENFSMTPIEYLNSLRVCEAIKLMQISDKKLTEIAIESGFSNVNYFTKVFKKSLKSTPSNYRLTLFPSLSRAGEKV